MGGWTIASHRSRTHESAGAPTCRSATCRAEALFERIAELLGKDPGIRTEDVFVYVLEAAKENWSVDNGRASFT